MQNKTVKISKIIENQLPEFVRSEFPLAQEFISQYYKSLEFPGAPLDLISNLDQYIKLDHLVDNVDYTVLTSDLLFVDNDINVESTMGFPDSYGIIRIDSEIITYESKNDTQFLNCARGFSGITSLNEKVDELTFSDTEITEHKNGAIVENLSILFLREFLNKLKKQIAPGFEGRELFDGVNKKIFLKQAKDFYKSKGTDSSFKILFYALFGEKVDVIKPRDYVIQPSDAQFRVTKNIIAELVSGNPENVINGTLYQDEDDFYPGARGTITNIEKINRQDKVFYVISLDYDYNKDIDVRGSIKSEFKINPKTIITNIVEEGSNYIDVDSTVGFPESGELIIKLENGTSIIVNYKSKTLNQFFECTGINQVISSKNEVQLNKSAYAYYGTEKVSFRITGVLSNIKIEEKNYLYSKDDTIQIKTLGSDLKGVKANNWFFNISTKYNVKKLDLLDESDYTYKLTLYDKHNFVIGDSFTLSSSTSNNLTGNIVFVENDKIIIIRGQGEIQTDLVYIIKKNISKVNLINYPELNFYSSNVQNVYHDLENSLYITSPSLPTYLNQPLKIEDESITFYGSFDSLDLTFKDKNNNLIFHSFFTGDSVVYKNNNITSSGVYFVKVINSNTIRLARSRENLFNDQFVRLQGTATGDKLELFEYNDRELNSLKLSPQSLIKKLTTPITDGENYETLPGTIGIFVNGVELLNYKSKDLIFYGPIEEIVPLSNGLDYDVINTPNLTVTDTSGSGCQASCSVTGSLKKIEILDAGFDYIETPQVSITGGNGTGAKAKVNLVSFDHEEKFFANSLNVSSNEIEFPEAHKFRDFEEVIYTSNGNSPIQGLVSESIYFVSVQNDYKIRLHSFFGDASVGINTINLTQIGSGIHIFRSKNKKKKIGSIEIENSGENYTNRRVKAVNSGISTSLNAIYVKNHKFKTGEIIQYQPTIGVISGLSTSGLYFVTTLNENYFKLSELAGENLPKDHYFKEKKYIELSSVGSGDHYFNYEPISVKIEGRIGVSTNNSHNFNASVRPIFRGEIDSVFVENGGKNYGSEEILNYNKQPEFNILTGSGAQLTPVVSDGKVVDVIIQSTGYNYYSTPELIVTGSGKGCVLTPIISNGTIIDVKIVSSGIGYGDKDTFVYVVNPGRGAKFEAKIRNWRVNLVERKLITSKINNDDGILHVSNPEFGLEYTHLYPSRALRESVLATKFENGKTSFQKDLLTLSGKELNSNSHSPIIGWSYDGNPIYGPYGFSSPSGGAIKCLATSYEIKTLGQLIEENRPSLNLYPSGFFIEDYQYVASGDLDEHNGRFCVTPEFPNGIYAYFSTINVNFIENQGIFKNYKKPQFPYVVGNAFKSKPIEFNFERSLNQKSFNINETSWVRNTTPYNLLSKNSGYDYIYNPNSIKKQLTDVKSSSKGSIDGIEILNPGENYKVNDKVIFSDPNIKSIVSSVKGVEVDKISVEQIEIENIEMLPYNSFLGIKTETSLLRDGDIVTITTSLEFNKKAKIKIKPPTKMVLAVGVGSTSVTGIITNFNVLGIPNSDLFENDIVKIEDEEVKILEIDRKNNKIKVERISGINSHQAGKILIENSNKFITNLGLSTDYNFKRNKEYYFESNRVVGLGTTYGVGITSTRFLDVENYNSKVSIGTGTFTTLYFNKTSEKERYDLNNFINIKNATNSSFNQENIKVIGTGQTFIQVDFDTSSLSVGSGVTAYLEKCKFVRVPTRTIEIPNHQLELNDQLVYTPPKNGDPIKVIDPKEPAVEYELNENFNLFVYPINQDLIGISTEPIENYTDILTNELLMFSDFGSNEIQNGQIHSLKTVYENKLITKVIKNVVTVETKKEHNLELKDTVTINCISGITTTHKIKYNDHNRRVTIGEFDINATDIDVDTNTIKINNHEFINGEKVIYVSSTPSIGLINQQIYYVFVKDQNNIKLLNNATELQKQFPNFVDIGSASDGKLSKINPKLSVVKYSTLIFDLSDPTLSFTKNNTKYPAFEFSIYTDSNFRNKFISSGRKSLFEVTQSGVVGVTTDAKLQIDFNEFVPEILYYKLTPINLKNNSAFKNEIIIDYDQLNYNKIVLVESEYNGKYEVIDTSLNPFTFKYTLKNYPEINEYTESNSKVSYTTLSKTASGGVDIIKILTDNKKYNKLPNINKIESENGKNCIVDIKTESIGKINLFEIQDIGFNYSSDLTIRPKAKLPEIIKVEPLSIVDSIVVISPGKNYNYSPNLIIKDQISDKVVDDITLDYDINKKNVNIIKNTEGINEAEPLVVPINNSNGIGINSISYDIFNKVVTVTLSSEFSSIEDFPFSVGEKVLIENISVASSERGYNSSVYNYALFTIIDLDANIGGAGATVSYSLANYIGDNEFPGTYNSTFLEGTIVPEKFFPKFKVNLKRKNFSMQEIVFSENSVGIVESWDDSNHILKISTDQDFYAGNYITGQSSKTKALIKEVISFEGYYDVESTSLVKNGWKNETGFLNNEYQRIHDSDYYQYFSYSLKSKVELNKWDDLVNSLNHTAGFKKFSDLNVESKPIVSGIITSQNFGDFTGINDLYSEIDLECVKDFDLVSENIIIIDNNKKSNEIYFENRILQDYIESIGNRVLKIDDISEQFNSNPRSTPYSIIDTSKVSDFKYKKYFVFSVDKRFSTKSELNIISLLHNESLSYINQYGKLYTEDILGYFDFNVFGEEGNLLYYPIKYEINNYDLNILSFSLDDIYQTSNEILLGSVAKIKTYSEQIPNNTTSTNIVGIGSTYRALKAIILLSSTDNSYLEVDEISIIHDGSNVYSTEYGQLNTGVESSSGIGTYFCYIDTNDLKIDFIPNSGLSTDFVSNSFVIALSDGDSTGIGSTSFNNNLLNSNYTSIGSSSSPTQNVIFSAGKNYHSSYFVISIEDSNNQSYQLSEVLLLYNSSKNETYITEYGVIKNNGNLGTINSGINGNDIELYFTPIPNISCEVRVFAISMGNSQDFKALSLSSNSINSGYGLYKGTFVDVKKSFYLTSNQLPIFERAFNSESSDTVNLESNLIKVPNNYFVTGEEINYVYDLVEDSPIGISQTSIPGIGLTTILPTKLYVIKKDDLNIQVAASASEALADIPVPLIINNLGIGTEHKFVSNDQNSKCLITIDNVVQSPIVGSSITSILINDIDIFNSELRVDDITKFSSNDIIKIDEELLRVVSVGVGSTNTMLVDREWFGTKLGIHSTNTLITKVTGNYNIVDNTIIFSEAPFGRIPVLNPTNRADEIDYVGIYTGSNFGGRVFLRSGTPNSIIKTYSDNYIFDIVSDSFDGYKNSFSLKSNNLDIVGISSNNGVFLLNEIFQIPSKTGYVNDYTLTENSGITSITFTGSPTTIINDVNTSSIPRGGIIVSVGSTTGLGYQPLVSAGGTAIVSISGTIQSISIGNSGSGYRPGIQTEIKVGVKTEDITDVNIEYIGIASVVNGNVVGVSITNPGTGYTQSNPPIVVFDDPLSYSNINLIYSEGSSGVGTGAIVDIVVGQGSSILNFEFKNYGFGYKKGDLLTVEVGGSTGIPTFTSDFNKFELSIDEVFNDSFAAWHFGNLQLIDSIEDLFNGTRKTFPIKINGELTTIKSKVGSNIDVESTLLVFINNILQIPGDSYIFKGGSVITFTEAPKGDVDGIEGTKDSCRILFYRGTSEIDTKNVDILETVKVGDNLTICSDDKIYQQTERTVEEIKSSDTVRTNLYYKDGISDDELLTRAVEWCKQRTDKFINGNYITKDRILYEPLVYPSTNLIKDAGINDSEIFVENIKTFFDNENENNIGNNSIVIIAQDNLISAAATAIVSIGGSITSIVLSDNGIGYSTTPRVSISEPYYSNGIQAVAISSITNNQVTNIQITNTGTGYTFTTPPIVLIESPTTSFEMASGANYEGDFGDIIGISTTTIGIGSTGLIFDFIVPLESFLRDSNINSVGVATTGISGIQTGYYFTISNSNVGFGITTLDSDGVVIGIGSTFIDTVYQAISVSIASTFAPGIGITNVTKVTTRVADYNGLSGIGFSGYYGNYSWGKIKNLSRKNPKTFISNKENINESPIVKRVNPLKYSNYIT